MEEEWWGMYSSSIGLVFLEVFGTILGSSSKNPVDKFMRYGSDQICIRLIKKTYLQLLILADGLFLCMFEI